MLPGTTKTTVLLMAMSCVILLAGCATSTSERVYRNRTSCPASFLLYCQKRHHGADEAPAKCRCVRQDSFNSMFSGD